LPPEYPFKPPHIIFLTPSGRFEVNTKVCLSFSAFHPELWQPAWGIRLILEALISFLPTPADGAIGAVDWSSHERKRLAIASHGWKCPHCGPIATIIPPLKEENTDGVDGTTKKSCSFAKEIAELHRLQQQAEAKNRESAGVDKVKTPLETSSTNEKTTEASSESLDMAVLEEEIVFDDNDDDDDEGKNDQVNDGESNLVNGSFKEDDQQQITLERKTPLELENVNNRMDSTAAAATTTNKVTLETPRDVGHETAPEIVVDDTRPTTTTTTTTTTLPITISWMYDPLLNILMVLLIAMCYLLVQKWRELSQELQALEAWEYRHQLEQNQLYDDGVAIDEATKEL
jgi:ubiquitin-conjugating enzyme E2 J1